MRSGSAAHSFFAQLAARKLSLRDPLARRDCALRNHIEKQPRNLFYIFLIIILGVIC
jgi:hypothetical protein